MRRRGFFIGVAVCLVVLVAFLAACGGSGSGTTTSGSGATATTAAGGASSATTAAASSDALANYKADMKGWLEKYNGDLEKKVAVLETITDPMNATADQIKGAKEFGSLVGEAAAGLQKIQPPTELASYHDAYADGMNTLSGGVLQYAKAMEDHSASELADAMTPMSSVTQIDQAETSLEQALGFKLTTQ